MGIARVSHPYRIGYRIGMRDHRPGITSIAYAASKIGRSSESEKKAARGEM